MLYGEHPYAHPPIGTIEGLKTISRDENHTVFTKHIILPNNSILTVVGDIDYENTLAGIKEAFGLTGRKERFSKF